MARSVNPQFYGPEAQEALLEAIGRFKVDAAGVDPLAPVTVIAPTPLAGYQIRRVLGRRPGGVVNVQVKPLHALIDLIGSPELVGQGRRPLPEVYRLESIRQVAETGETPFGDVPVETAFLRNLSQRFDEFDRRDRAELDQIAAQPGIPSFLISLYDRHIELTREFYTRRELTDSATRALEHWPPALRDIGDVIVYLPGELSAPERRFLDALAEHTSVELIVGLTGDVEAVDRSALERWDAPLSDSESESRGVPTAQRIVQAPDAEDEVRSAIRSISAELQSERPTPLHRNAILYRQADPYARICAEQLDAAGIPWNGLNSQTLGQSIAGRTLHGLLGLMTGGAITWSAEVAPWLSAAPIRSVGDRGGAAPVARWNQLARRANLQRGPDDWLPRLARYRESTQDDLERLQRVPDDEKPGRLPWVESELEEIDALTTFVTQLVQFASDAPTSGAWSAHSQHARAGIAMLLGQRAQFARFVSGEDDRELARWDDVHTLLTELTWLDDLGAVEAERFVGAARRGLERPAGHHRRVGDGVYVGPLRLAVGMEWDCVYIVGVAERSLPQIRQEDPLLSDALRQQATLPVASDHLRQERTDYLAALHAAERRVLSYPRADIRAEQARLPGRWLLESATALNDGERVYASKIDQAPKGVIEVTSSFERAIMDSPEPADAQEYDLRSVSSTRRPRAHWLAQEFPALGRGFEELEERWQPYLTRWDGLLAGGAAQAVSRPHSAGALQDWATCPYRYFLGRVLRIAERDPEPDDLQISALDKGSLIHNILDAFFKQAKSQPSPSEQWSQAERERLTAIAERMLDEAQQRGLTGRDLLWRRDRQRILDDLQRLLDEDNEHRAQRGVQQVGSELVFGQLPDSEVDVELALEDGAALDLRGMIDRVDRSPDGSRVIVIDYKTGLEFPKGRELEQDPIVGGRFLQLPVYAEAARKRFAVPDSVSVGSAYWFITRRGDFKYNGVEWDDERSERFHDAVNLVAESVRQGVFPANPGGEHRSARGEHCNICSFDAICPADRRSHWERIKGDPALSDYIALSEGLQDEADDD